MFDYYKSQDGKIYEIGFDEYACVDSPRDWDNLGTFLTWLYRHESPDKNDYSDFEEFINSFGIYPDNWNWTEEDVLPELIKKADEKGYFLFPIYVYEHSQLTYSINPTIPYGGIGGVIFVEKEKIFQETSLTPKTENLVEKVKEMLGGEVEDYDNWSNGYIMQISEYDLNEQDFINSYAGYLGLDIKENGIYYDYDIENMEYLGEFSSVDQCINSLVLNGKIKREIKWAS